MLLKTLHHSSHAIILNWKTTKIITTCCLTVWYWNCTISACKTLQQILRTADKIIRVFLPNTSYSKRCIVLAEGTRASVWLPSDTETASPRQPDYSTHYCFQTPTWTNQALPYTYDRTNVTAHLHFIDAVGHFLLLLDNFLLSATCFFTVNSLQTVCSGSSHSTLSC